MLFAVEGGGFFSSSASGYSKGLTLLFLGQQKEEGSTRVLPWNQYQLVDQEAERDLQLASRKDRVSQGCTSFVCFRRTPAGLEVPFPPKVGPIQKQDVLSETSISSSGEDCCSTDDGDIDGGKTYLKSSLRKSSDFTQRASRDDGLSGQLEENGNDVPSSTEGKKVQWTDACGEELVEIREFEPSDESTSDGEYENENERDERACACVIM